MKTFEAYRNRTFLGPIKAVSMRQAVQTASKRYGRCEVLGGIAKPELTAQHSDYGRTQGRAPCNQSAMAKAKIEAIRLQAIADYT